MTQETHGQRLTTYLALNRETRPPNANDDSTQGYQVGSTWIDTNSRRTYICVDITPGAAVWDRTRGVVSILGFSGANAIIEKGATVFVGLGTGRVEPTEANAEFYLPSDGEVENLHVYVGTNASDTAGNTVAIRKNGINTALAVSYGAGETGLKTNLSDTVNVQSGDRISIETKNTSGGGGFKDLTLSTVTIELV